MDLGKTSCRVSYRRADGSDELAQETDAGMPGLAEQGGVAAAVAAIERPLLRLHRRTAELLPAPAESGGPMVIGVGAAGALAAPGAAAELAGRLLGAWPEWPFAAAAVTSDALTAHLGALGGSAGVVLVAGTGATAVAVGDDGTLAVSGGWGPVLGDEGSGGWIGAAGLQAALRDLDGRGPGTSLRAAAESKFGALQHLPRSIAADQAPAQATARFAAAVDDAAARGDRIARGIIDAAAGELAVAITAAARRAGAEPDRPLPASVVGGMLHLPTLAARLGELLAANGSVVHQVPARGSALDGAALLLAGGPPLPHEPHVHRAGSD